MSGSEHSEEGGYRRGVCQALLWASRRVFDMVELTAPDNEYRKEVLAEASQMLSFYGDLAYRWRYGTHEDKSPLLDALIDQRLPGDAPQNS